MFRGGAIRMTAREPWLSVVMPGHEGADWIGAAVASVAAEDDGGIELVLLDSSRDDASVAAARAAAGAMRLHGVRVPDMPSWIDKTNRAVALARAPHVAMLHQDDLWLPGRAAAVRRWIAAAPDADLHLAPTWIVDRRGRRLGLWRCPLPDAVPLGGPDLVTALAAQNFVSVPAPVVRREAWLACGGLDPALWYTADWDLWLKLARGRTRYHAEATTGFRVHGGSLTMTGSRDRGDFARQMETVLDRHLAAGRTPVRRLAEASIRVNVALAEAGAGRMGRGLLDAFRAVLGLGPIGAVRYLGRSRLLERALPRLRARLAGQL